MIRIPTILVCSYFSKLSKSVAVPFGRQLSTNPRKIMKIGTHNGVFHCDEALACYMLKKLPQYKDAEIVRTRDQSKLDECDIVVDVGAVFDHQKKRYDHHQREFDETLSTLKPEIGDKYKIKLSSAGLIYAHYGEAIIREIAPKDILLDPENLQIIYKKVYENLIEEIDGIDNGVPMTDGEPKYKIHTNISSRVRRLNPEWNSKEDVNMDEVFTKAMDLVGEEFMYTLIYITSVWLPARIFVKTALENRFETHKSGKIVEFTEGFPWKDHLFDLEKEMGIEQEVSYALFRDKLESWRVQAVPITPTSFVLRNPLHKSWRGLRDETLSDIAGIPDCIFCHSTGFICGNKTRNGALRMAIYSLESI